MPIEFKNMTKVLNAEAYETQSAEKLNLTVGAFRKLVVRSLIFAAPEMIDQVIAANLPEPKAKK